MIGIIAKNNEKETVQEFFELFKTPWEFYQKSQRYDVILSTCDSRCEIAAKLFILYGSEEKSLDQSYGLGHVGMWEAPTLQSDDFVFPIYGKARSFQSIHNPIIKTIETADNIAGFPNAAHCKFIRIGFDLFQEVKYLLKNEQSLQNAQIPTLDIHIAIIRNWIVDASIPLIEVVGHPAGFSFTVCLTHDVDFLRIRDHKLDRTMFGFLYRALFRSLVNFLKGRISLVKLVHNWCAICLLPGVYLGIIKDYFFQLDRYLEVEKDLTSTFFVLPFKNRPGVDRTGQVKIPRASRYDITDIKPEIGRLIEAGHEIALHGIDAWRDATQGREELQRIAHITGDQNIGIRSHWLYQCDLSPQFLEEAGFVYDSSVGYNETIGFRSGTTQVFRPFGVSKLLELPLHIMDTALFYSGRMDLAEHQAIILVEIIIAQVERFGGILTINWHHRSMGPERLWDHFYENMVSYLKGSNVWFATASQAVSWFRTRRSVCFHTIQFHDDKVQVKLSSCLSDGPQLMLRVYLSKGRGDMVDGLPERAGRVIDVPFSGNLDTFISI